MVVAHWPRTSGFYVVLMAFIYAIAFYLFLLAFTLGTVGLVSLFGATAAAARMRGDWALGFQYMMVGPVAVVYLIILAVSLNRWRSLTRGELALASAASSGATALVFVVFVWISVITGPMFISQSVSIAIMAAMVIIPALVVLEAFRRLR